MAAVQTPTKRQKLRHALACQRLGLDAPGNALLEVERPVLTADVEPESKPCLEPTSAHFSRRAITGLLHSDRESFTSIEGHAIGPVRQAVRACQL